MITIPFDQPLPRAGVIEAFRQASGWLCIQTQADYAVAPADVRAIVNARAANDAASSALAAQEAADAATARTYPKLSALVSMTPAQVDAWVTANVTTLAQAQDAIKTLAIAVSVLARRLV